MSESNHDTNSHKRFTSMISILEDKEKTSKFSSEIDDKYVLVMKLIVIYRIVNRNSILPGSIHH